MKLVPLLVLPSLLLSTPAAASSLAPRSPLAKRALHAPRLPDAPEIGHQFHLKLQDAARARLDDQGRLVSLTGADLSATQELLDAWGLRAVPLVDLEPTRIEALRARAEARTGRQAADLQGMFRLVGLEDGDDMVLVGTALQELAVVELAEVVVVGAPPPGDIGSTTPDYSSYQGYLDEDPGIGAWTAWEEEGLVGETVRVSDVEYGWEASHEDLVDVDLGLEDGMSIPSWVALHEWDNHGTAVLGEIMAPSNGYGMTGGAHGVEVGTYPEYSTYSRRAEAITAAATDSDAGDVILLEMQTVVRPGGDYAPAECDATVFLAVQTAVDAGVVVVGAAGNGDEDLDNAWYTANYLSWGDSGAIIVGAGTADTRHDKLYFSTHGARVNVQGWGGSVDSLSYGDLAWIDRDDDQRYTASFSGTSSASPIVTVAAALVQDYANSTLGRPLAPTDLRSLLVDTGIAQGSGDPIGPLPSVMDAIDALDGDRDGFGDSAYGGWDCDDEDAAVGDECYEDADDDGYPSLASGGPDCDDADPEVNPGVEETWYDGLDADCDGASDDDADRDGVDSDEHGGLDCDDTDASVYPGATETWYDGVDADCAGDSDSDLDGDGWDGVRGGGEDCDDGDEAVHPDAVETWYDGLDQDCSGGSDFDADGDGQMSADYRGADCDDADPLVYRGAEETWYDGIDADCEGDSDYDADGDGQDAPEGGGADCQDDDATVFDGAPEVEGDGVDQDCNGVDSGVDSDGDGLDDDEEVDLYGTDPLLPDTDEGGVRDGDEVAAGTDPLDGSDDDGGTSDGGTGDGGTGDGGTSDGGTSDGGAGDGGTSDGGTSDGGTGDGGTSDGGTSDGGTSDGGTGDGGTSDGGSGDTGAGDGGDESCGGCASGSAAPAGLAMGVVGLLGLVARRRR